MLYVVCRVVSTQVFKRSFVWNSCLPVCLLLCLRALSTRRLFHHPCQGILPREQSHRQPCRTCNGKVNMSHIQEQVGVSRGQVGRWGQANPAEVLRWHTTSVLSFAPRRPRTFQDAKEQEALVQALRLKQFSVAMRLPIGQKPSPSIIHSTLERETTFP